MKKYLITGLLIWIPLAITFMVLAWIVGTLDLIIEWLPDGMQPRAVLGFNLPGVGLVLSVLIVLGTGLVAEIGDLSRFDNPRQLMAWFGLVPSEHSSGPSVRKGSITKCGNGYARRLIVEAAWAYRYKPQVSRIIEKRHAGLPKPIIDRAWDAHLRLCKRFRKLSARGKHHNVALVAVARELTGFIWDIARRVPVAAP